ncbi:MAG: peptide chain release factor N(5)-glutamine methyltransferase [Flavobacteriales bacterium]|nr:peptide chain release factor N(5)-glutamine methyltransferase [Flavobacteriales bacterium]
MLLKTYKTYFINQLLSLYPQEEITSFFGILCAHYLKTDRMEMALAPKKVLHPKEEQQLENALEKLKKQIPIQYITGETEFYGLPFLVNPAVLIPRPETEELVDWIWKKHQSENIHILDIGTGSGCIAISLAKNLPGTFVTALDVSKEAIATAKTNAKLNDVEIAFLQEDILNIKILEGKWDVIVSNPPYIKDGEKKQMSNNVLEYEPHLALFVPDVNPLLFYKKIAQLAKNHLKDSGVLYFEINEALGKEVISMLEKEGFQNMELRKDLYGKDRMVSAKFK